MYRPEINAGLALGVAEQLQGPLPELTRPETRRVVSTLRLTAVRAGRLAARRAQLGGQPASHVAVVDRIGWARNATLSVETLLDTLELPPRPDGPRRRLNRAAYGLGGGLALAAVSRSLLGQFDAFVARPTLYLIAPNLVRMAARMPGRDDDFYLWVAAHEQTHALQFSAVDWLEDYALGLFKAVATDESQGHDVIRGLTDGRGLMSAFVSEAGGARIEQLRAMMTLLEGHADLISDLLGSGQIRNVRAFRRRFQAMRASTRWWQRAFPAGDKDAQYRIGLEFCTVVKRRVGIRGLNQVFASAEGLPTMPELHDPEIWLKRIHGTS